MYQNLATVQNRGEDGRVPAYKSGCALKPKPQSAPHQQSVESCLPPTDTHLNDALQDVLVVLSDVSGEVRHRHRELIVPASRARAKWHNELSICWDLLQLMQEARKGERGQDR